jgi:hypothetical protein
VILVVLSGQFRADLSEFGTDDLQALLFEAADDATHETALDGIWLKNDEACFHVVLRKLWGGKDSKKPSQTGHSADRVTVPALRRQTTKHDAARDPGRWAREALIRERM